MELNENQVLNTTHNVKQLMLIMDDMLIEIEDAHVKNVNERSKINTELLIWAIERNLLKLKSVVDVSINALSSLEK